MKKRFIWNQPVLIFPRYVRALSYKSAPGSLLREKERKNYFCLHTGHEIKSRSSLWWDAFTPSMFFCLWPGDELGPLFKSHNVPLTTCSFMAWLTICPHCVSTNCLHGPTAGFCTKWIGPNTKPCAPHFFRNLFFLPFLMAAWADCGFSDDCKTAPSPTSIALKSSISGGKCSSFLSLQWQRVKNTFRECTCSCCSVASCTWMVPSTAPKGFLLTSGCCVIQLEEIISALCIVEVKRWTRSPTLTHALCLENFQLVVV